MIDIHKQAFVEEATELLSELEVSLLELENTPDDRELIAKIFRALHTIKGSSGMFGFDAIASFTHNIENAYDLIRNGELRITKNIIDLTLSARDQINAMLGNPDLKHDKDNTRAEEILNSFKKIIGQCDSSKNSIEEVKATVVKDENQSSQIRKTIYSIRFKPFPEIFYTGNNPVLLLNELKQLGKTILLLRDDLVPHVEELEPEKCYLYWDIVINTDKGIDAIKDVFIFIEDQCELKIKEFDCEGKLSDEQDFLNFELFALEHVNKTEFDLETLLLNYKPLNSALLISKKQDVQIKKTDTSHEKDSKNDLQFSIRVKSEKLDEIVNLVGEMVTLQARLSQIALTNKDPKVLEVSEEVERITWSLRNSALNIRMLPIGATFSKYKRLVRDLSIELGKEVELITDGAETELDKIVIEKLNDPLVHIIRNSLDHGIEPPDEREKAGKKRIGQLHLAASQSGGNVLIKIRDDGYGIDKNVIREKAIKQGLINENSELSDPEIYSLIFAAGFSTAKKVTNVSGRGVGMDVVRRAIENLRGTVEVFSEVGNGTTITLKLPLTLAIIDGLLVKIEDDHYVLPLSSIEECIELTKNDIETMHGRHMVNIRGGIVPYISLRERFGMAKTGTGSEQVVITQVNGNRIGFVVDEVIGQHQTVLKSLGNFYKHVECVSGATILGDGNVALILDVTKLTEHEELEEKQQLERMDKKNKQFLIKQMQLTKN